MLTETTPVIMDTPFGKLYVAVTTAKEDEYHVAGRGNVTDLHPCVRVATDPTFEADPNHADHWTIRGRAYAVHRTFWFQDRSHIVYGNGVSAGRWHGETSPYKGGYRNDRRNEVKYGTKTYDLMDQAVTDALDKFAADHPQWGDLSLYLLFNRERNSALAEVARLNKEAAQAAARAAEWAGKADPARHELPADLAALIRD